ncbi:MAG TPA: NAD(P)-binding domain-containing protein, partial [Acidimicrobiales bacterium]|nr:NAD(P)-binding domain-containing protein [Acidimicrobiales bacterium]
MERVGVIGLGNIGGAIAANLVADGYGVTVIDVDPARASAVAGASPKPLHHVLALQREGYLLIPLAEVCYFQVEDGVTHVKTATASY